MSAVFHRVEPDRNICMTTYKVLSIDAWAEGEGWVWNQWYKIGETSLPEGESDEALIQRLADEGFLRGDLTKAMVDDDQYNLVICNSDTGEPVIAVEYGAP